MATVHLPIRQLVEFLLRTGSIDSRFTGFDRALEGAHIHRKLQKAAGDGYQAEVFLSVERQAEDITFTLEGRADGIFTDETGTVVIDEIKTTAVPPEEITEDMNPLPLGTGHGVRCHLCRTAKPAGTERPADLLSDRHRSDHPLYPPLYAAGAG